ncbi:MAG: PGPGW domain-containing protein [Myxococcales bacterium]
MERLTAHARKVLTVSAGTVLLVVGIALLVLPGPGIPLIIVGLTLLGAHFAWARNLRERVVKVGKSSVRRLRALLSRSNREPSGGAAPGRRDASAGEV